MIKLLISVLFFPVLLFCAESVTVTGFSNKNTASIIGSQQDNQYEGLFYNGILGYGFVQKDEASLHREEILENTRKCNDKIANLDQFTYQELKEELSELLEDREEFWFLCPTIYQNSYPIEPDELEQLESWRCKGVPNSIELQYEGQFLYIQNQIDAISWRIAKMKENIKHPVLIKLNPVIRKINSDQKQLRASVPIYKFLQDLRQKFDTFYDDNVQVLAVKLENNQLPGFFLNLLIENPNGIQIEYSDDKIVFIYFDKEKDKIFYTWKPN